MREPTVRAPHPALSGLVTGYHGYRHAGMAAGVHHGLPSTSLTAVVAFDEPLDVGWLDDPASRGRHWVMVSGLHVAPALIHHGGAQHGVQLELTPLGARRLLGVPAGALAGTLLPLDLSAAYDALAAATTWDARHDVLDRVLLDRLASCREPRPPRAELTHVWARIRGTRGGVRVEELAREVGWSRRHLTQRFTAEFGIGPKQAARVERFQRARLLLTRDFADATPG